MAVSPSPYLTPPYPSDVEEAVRRSARQYRCPTIRKLAVESSSQPQDRHRLLLCSFHHLQQNNRDWVRLFELTVMFVLTPH